MTTLQPIDLKLRLLIGYFRSWCHLENKDGCHPEILFADWNLKMLLQIDFKPDKVEGRNPGPVSQLLYCIHLAYIHPAQPAFWDVQSQYCFGTHSI